MTYDDYIDSMKSYLLKKTVESSFKYIISKAAFLAWGPLAPLVKMVLEKIIWVLINKTELALFMKFIDVRVDRQGRDFYAALERNHAAQNGGDPNEILLAEKALEDNFRNLVKLTN